MAGKLKFPFLFLFTLLLLPSFGFAEGEGRKLAHLLTESQEALNSVNGQRDPCGTALLTDSEGRPVRSGEGFLKTPESETARLHGKFGTLKTLQGREFEISVVDYETAKRLFDEMASKDYIPFKYPEDGCYARAHEMSRLLEQKGILTGKVFIEGSLRVETSNSPKGYVEWWYHVAPVLLVEKDGKQEVYVIDPSIFDRPVPAEEWYAIQTKHDRGRRDRTYNTPRFVYTPISERDELQTDYLKADIDSMKATMASYLKIQQEREQRKQREAQ